MRWINEDRMDDAILLMSKMSETKLGKILKTFETDAELDSCTRSTSESSAAAPETEQLEKALGELNAVDGKS